MKRIRFLSILFFTTSAFAANVWFDPPNPTSRTPLTAHVTVQWNGCTAKSATAERHANIISISLDTSQCASSGPVDTAVDLGVVPAGVYDVVVGPGQLLVLIAEGTLVVRDAEPQVTVLPNVAYHGGDTLTVKCASACPNAAVSIGGTNAPVVKQTDANTVVVNAPIDQPGIVDLVVTSNGQTLRSAAAFDYFDQNGPFDPAFFEPVLFPVMINGPGALGSQWSTEAVMRNENDYRFPLRSVFDLGLATSPTWLTQPEAHFTARAESDAPNGYVLYVPRESAPRLWFGTLVKDLSRQAEALGTEIPVVREQDLFGRPFEIVDVPSDPRYRVALRVYRVDGTPFATTMHLRILTLDSSDTALVDDEVVLSGSSGSHAALAITDLVAKYPQLAGKGSLLIEIDPESVRPVGWGFVSVTNNQTQHVTVVSPQ